MTKSDPSFPSPAPIVGAEIEIACIERDGKGKIVNNRCPSTFEWFKRLKKFEQQLEVK